MVVRHGHDDVEFARVVRRVARAHEHGVGRVGAAGGYALGHGGSNGRGDDELFLVAEEAALAGMRVQPRHRNARLTQPPRGRRPVGDAQRLQHGVESHGLDGPAQRQVDGDQHDAQLIVGQHHAHGRWLGPHAGCSGQGLQHLGVPRIEHAGCSQGFLVDRRGDDGAAGAGQHQRHRMFDAARRRGAVAGVDRALRQRRQAAREAPRLHQRQAARWHLGQVVGRVDHRRHGSPCAAQHAGVPDHHGVAQLTERKGAGDDLRADAGGVAHGHDQGLHAGLSTSMNRCSRPNCAATCAATAGAP